MGRREEDIEKYTSIDKKRIRRTRRKRRKIEKLTDKRRERGKEAR